MLPTRSRGTSPARDYNYRWDQGPPLPAPCTKPYPYIYSEDRYYSGTTTLLLTTTTAATTTPPKQEDGSLRQDQRVARRCWFVNTAHSKSHSQQHSTPTKKDAFIPYLRIANRRTETNSSRDKNKTNMQPRKLVFEYSIGLGL